VTLEILDRFISVFGKNVYIQEAGDPESPVILFLHGASFTSQTWKEIGSLEFFAMHEYRPVALDLPSYGRSSRILGHRNEFLVEFLNSIGIAKTVIISPSMSGNYSLPFLVKYPDKLLGYVPVAPVGIQKYATQLRGLDVPTLALWGESDRIIPNSQADIFIQQMKNARKVILKNAGHACYMKATDEFHQQVLDFLKQIEMK